MHPRELFPCLPLLVVLAACGDPVQPGGAEVKASRGSDSPAADSRVLPLTTSDLGNLFFGTHEQSRLRIIIPNGQTLTDAVLTITAPNGAVTSYQVSNGSSSSAAAGCAEGDVHPKTDANNETTICVHEIEAVAHGSLFTLRRQGFPQDLTATSVLLMPPSTNTLDQIADLRLY